MVKLGLVSHYLKGRPRDKCRDNKMQECLKKLGVELIQQPVPVAALSKAQVCGPSPAQIVGSKPTGAWMSVCFECCVLSGRGLCDELITRPEESYRLWLVVVCDLETSKEEAKSQLKGCEYKPTMSCDAEKKKLFSWLGILQYCNKTLDSSKASNLLTE